MRATRLYRHLADKAAGVSGMPDDHINEARLSPCPGHVTPAATIPASAGPDDRQEVFDANRVRGRESATRRADFLTDRRRSP